MLSFKDKTHLKIDGGLNLHDDISFFMKQNFKFSDLKSECWVLNMSSNYSKKNLDINNIDLEKYAISIFENKFILNNRPFFTKTHRWLYAQTNITYNSLSKKKWINSKVNFQIVFFKLVLQRPI